MKRIFAVKLMILGVTLTVLSSCGSGRHKCPAYGSVYTDNSEIELAQAK